MIFYSETNVNLMFVIFWKQNFKANFITSSIISVDTKKYTELPLKRLGTFCNSVYFFKGKQFLFILTLIVNFWIFVTNLKYRL